MKKWVVFLLALSLMATACANDDAETVEGGEEEPIIIGAVAGLTGFMSPFDTPALEGMKLAVEDINEQGGVLGRPLELISRDSKSDKVEPGTAAAELLDRGAEFITTPCDFDFGAAAAVEAQKHEVVGISMCAGAVQFGVQGIGPYGFTMGMAAASAGTAQAEWAYEEQGWRTAYVLQDDFVLFQRQTCASFAARWERLSGTQILGTDHFQEGDPSIASQIRRLKALHEEPDVLVFCSVPPGGVSALKQLRDAGIDLPILAGNALDGLYWQEGVPGISDVYTVTFADITGNDPVPEVNQVRERLEDRLGSEALEIGSYWLPGYSTVEAFKIAAERADATSGPEFKEALESFRDEPLLVGKTTFTEDLHISLSRPVRVIETQNGEVNFLTMWEPQEVPPIGEWVEG